VEFLLKKNATVDIRCVGDFFRPPKRRSLWSTLTGGIVPQSSTIYMGEHPLSFAACVNNIEKSKAMIKLLIEHGATFDSQDIYGNTVLHVMVIKENLEVYNYIMDLFELYREEGSEPLDSIQNKQKRTPLALAAALGKAEMFEGIMKRKRVLTWIYGHPSFSPSF